MAHGIKKKIEIWIQKIKIWKKNDWIFSIFFCPGGTQGLPE